MLLLITTTACANIAKNNSKNAPIIETNKVNVKIEEVKEVNEQEEKKVDEDEKASYDSLTGYSKSITGYKMFETNIENFPIYNDLINIAKNNLKNSKIVIHENSEPNTEQMHISGIEILDQKNIRYIVEVKNSGLNIKYLITISMTDEGVKDIKIDGVVGNYIFKDGLFIAGIHEVYKYYMLYSKFGKNEIIDEENYTPEDWPGGGLSLYNPEIIENGKYLVYEFEAYNYHGFKYYDLEKMIKRFTSVWPIDKGFNSSGKYYYSCNPDMPPVAREKIIIRKAPDFEIYKELNEESDPILDLYLKLSCVYSPESDSLLVTLSEPKEDAKVTEIEHKFEIPFSE